MIAHLIVRATVPAVQDRKPFDEWYGQEHMPQAIAAFHPVRAWRSWSKLDAAVHYAIYEFAEEAQIDAMTASPEFAEMVADTSRRWDGKVTRERDVIKSVQILPR
ncbi:hypothetical protein BH09PSE5_BH09PSE5_41940 [soil metagenome]